MKNENDPSAEILFIRNIVAVDIVLIIVSAFISRGFNYEIGMILFVLGLLTGGIGAYLGGPNPSDPNNPGYPRLQSIFSRKHPIQQKVDQISYDVKGSVKGYAFENVLMVAGLAAIVLSAPFIISIMFSK